MRLAGMRIGIYGRLLDFSRDAVARQISELGGTLERGLTRQSTLLVIGFGALRLIPSGHLLRHVRNAEARSVPVIGEARLGDLIAGRAPEAATYPLARVTPAPTPEMVALLNAFDLIHIRDGHCRFADVGTLRTAERLATDGHEMSSIVRVLRQAKSNAPLGRYDIVTERGDAVLSWGDAVTELDGQGLLRLPDEPDLEDLFESAQLAEADGRLELAARAYEQCASIDRKDAIAPFNLANVLHQMGRDRDAINRYAQAIARDPGFAESHYNRALLFEKSGAPDAAIADLEAALRADPDYTEAIFNLAQLEMTHGNPATAKTLFDRFLSLSNDPDWRAVAEKARLVAGRTSGAPDRTS